MHLSVQEARLLLGFPEQGTPPAPDALRRAFKQQALIWHPDKHPLRPATAPACEAGASSSGANGAAAEGVLDPEERFKLLATAYHTLLHQQGQEQQQQQQGSGGPPSGWQPPGAGVAEEESLLDSVSAELLLREAARLGLSDFDIIYLHHLASRTGGPSPAAAGASGVDAVWPEAVRSIDGIWRRIQLRLERRRQRQGGQGAAGAAASGVSFRGPSARKWAMLYDFVADMVCAPAEEEEAQGGEPHGQAAAGEGQVHAGADNGADNACAGGEGAGGGSASEVGLEGREPAARGSAQGEGTECGGEASMAQHRGGGNACTQLVPERRKGSLPRAFYWTWLKRIVIAKLLWSVLMGG